MEIYDNLWEYSYGHAFYTGNTHSGGVTFSLKMKWKWYFWNEDKYDYLYIVMFSFKSIVLPLFNLTPKQDISIEAN